MLREIVIDTETTGFDPLGGHRIVEIGAVELINHAPTGETFHRYICPQRDVPADAIKVHGLTAEFLADKPVFSDVVDDFLSFIGDAQIIAHNAGFDIGFLNAELKRARKPLIEVERVIDTLVMARRKHAGHNTLDDLCSRYGIDRSRRKKHGALLDAELLSAIYVELAFSRQSSFRLDPIKSSPSIVPAIVTERQCPLAPRVTAEDRAAHQAFVRTLGANAIWLDYEAIAVKQPDLAHL
jgi:DNA polymerase III subunit epsilon